MSDPADPPRGPDLPPPRLRGVESPSLEEVLDSLPSKEEVIKSALSTESIMREQPSVDELLRRNR